MGNIKQINIKNYFFNGIINIKDFESSLLKIDKKLYKNTITYSIGYIKIKKIDDQENNHSVDPLYLMIEKIDWCVEEKNWNSCLVFTSMELHSADENKEVLKKYKEIWDRIKNKIETIMIVKQINMVKNSWKINLTVVMICCWISH